MSDRAPLWAIVGTPIAALLFIGVGLILVPLGITGGLTPTSGPAVNRWLGLLLVALAAPVLLDFLVRFVREGHGTPAPIAPPGRLVVGGVFRFVRNPAYLAAFTVLLGEALAAWSVNLLVYALGLGVLFHLLVVLVEEPALRRTFGDAYETYCREVPRWIPRRRRRADV